MSRTKVELFLVAVEDLKKGDFIWINDPQIGFGPGGKVMTASRVFQCVDKVYAHSLEYQCILTTGNAKHIVEKGSFVIVATPVPQL